VVAILGLAIGANAAVFSVTRAVLMRTLPYEAPERTVQVQPSAIRLQDRGDWAPNEDFLALPEVEEAGLYIPGGGANLVDARGATRLEVTQVDAGFFPTLGVEAVVGRLIGPNRSTFPEAVLSHSLWLETYGADRGIVGRSMELSGHRFTVVGVAPADVDLPAGTDVWASTPAVMDFYGSAFGPSMIARLRSVEAIPALIAFRRAEFAGIPEHLPRPEVAITPLQDQLVGPIRMPLLVLTGAAAAILLLGCLNLTGIEVARVYRRAGELGVRRALGAGTSRIFRQLAGEVVLLALLAGSASLVVAWLGGRVLVSILPAELPGLLQAGLTTSVVAFTALAAAASAVMLGLPPAMHGARVSRLTAARTTTADRQRVRLQQALVIAQVSVAVVLSVVAGLLGRSLIELRTEPLGYDTRSVLTFRVHLPSHVYASAVAQRNYAEQVEGRLALLPGVEAVGYATRLPLASGMGLAVGLQPGGGGELLSAAFLQVSDSFFDAMGIRLLAGSSPTPPIELEGGFGGVVIDRAAAERLFGGLSAVGEPIVLDDRLAVVAGIADDVRLLGYEGTRWTVVYASVEAGPLQSISFAVRTRDRPGALAAQVREVLAQVDPSVPAFEVRTTGDAIAEELAARQALTTLSGLFGLVGLLLVGLGLYGIVAQGVAGRRRELGIRLALGAKVGRVVGGTIARALLLVLAGVAVGVPLAAAVARIIRSLLYGVGPEDPAVILTLVAVVLAVGVLAAAVPASHIAGIDPSEALRHD
jgi:predicted permease